jgi:hypothetical protein
MKKIVTRRTEKGRTVYLLKKKRKKVKIKENY